MKTRVMLFCLLSSIVSSCSEQNKMEPVTVPSSREPIAQEISNQQLLQEVSTLKVLLTVTKEQDVVMQEILGMIEKLSTRMRSIEGDLRTLKNQFKELKKADNPSKS